MPNYRVHFLANAAALPSAAIFVGEVISPVLK